MKKITILLLSLALNSTTYASDYPKSKVEQEMDEMGSISGGEGLVFRPTLVKNKSTKAKIGNVNKYLYKSAIETLKFAPLTSADSNNGMIVTEWYSPKGQKNTQFKINVLINGDVISPTAIEVIAHERSRIDGKWSEDYVDSPIASVIEDKILRKARDLYLKDQKNQ